jgi:hypothetical protein
MSTELIHLTCAYRVFVDQNSHDLYEHHRTEVGSFETAEEALAACQQIVDDFLARTFQTGMRAKALYEAYKAFGKDPFIVSTDPKAKFSAWEYVEGRCMTICGEEGDRINGKKSSLYQGWAKPSDPIFSAGFVIGKH